MAKVCKGEKIPIKMNKKALHERAYPYLPYTKEFTLNHTINVLLKSFWAKLNSMLRR